MLPEEADRHLIWLNEELRSNKRLQVDLLDEFNSRLADLGIGSISKSAFSRYAVRKATQFRQIDETRRISVELAEMLGTDSADQMTIAVAEMTKVAAFGLFEQGGLAPADIQNLSRALKDAVGAQKLSMDYRQAIEREAKDKVAEAARDIAAIGAEGGVSAETMEKITRRLAGVF